MSADTAVPGRRALRIGPVSTVRRIAPMAVVVVGGVLALLVAAVTLTVGDFALGLGQVLAALVGAGTRSTSFVVVDLRLPETLTGLLVGAALGLSGAVTQTVARNPLASPDLTGVTQGAGAGALVAIVLGVPVTGLSGALAVPAAALVGGLGTGLAVVALAWRGGLDSQRMVLIGVGMTFAMVAVTSYLLTVARIEQASQAKIWLTGSLTGRGWEHVVPVAVALLVLVPATLVQNARLGALALGDDVAGALGVSVDRTRTLLLVLAAVLAAVATACAGPIEFVALVAPQVALRLARTSRPPLVGSMVLAALLTVAADLVTRTLLAGIGTPVGVVTAVIGGPFLLYLLTRTGREVRA